jgi:hypothetical protein
MKIVNSKGEMRSSTPRDVTNRHHVSGPQERKQILSLPDPGPAAPVERAPELVRACGGFQPQPGCFVCGTGIDICSLHEPEVRALMAERRIDEVDASYILAQQFAKQRHGFPKTA